MYGPTRMFEVRYGIRNPVTGKEGVLRLAGGIWTGDVCGFEFTDTVFGLAGTATCDWREPRSRLWIDEGIPADPGPQALLDKITTLLLPFHRSAFRHLTDAQLHDPRSGDHLLAMECAADPATEPGWQQNLLDQVLRLCAPRRALDVGCSTGDVVRHLRDRGIDARGCDLCREVDCATPPEVAPHVRRGSVDAIPYGRADAFDTLLALDVFEHVPEHRIGAMISEFARLGVQRIVAHIALCEFQWPGHVTLRPLSWWDRQLAPWFHRVVPPTQPEVAAAFAGDPSRYLRVYELSSVPAAV